MEWKNHVLGLVNGAVWRVRDQRPSMETPLRAALFNGARQSVTRLLPLFNLTVMLGLTTRCQCKCSHCGAAKQQAGPRQEMGADQILALIQALSRLGSYHLYLFGGEPLLVPQLAQYVRHARNQGLAVSLDTNGLLLDREMARTLKGAGVNLIRVSIDSAMPDKHDALRGVKGTFARAVAGIRRCGELGIERHISTYATKENLHNGELEQVLALARRLGVKVRLLPSIRSGKWTDKEDVVLTPKEVQQVKTLLAPGAVYWEVEFCDSGDKPLYCAVRERKLAYIDPFGDLHPCCYVNAPFGNVLQEPVESILRRMWKQKISESSASCDECVSNDGQFLSRLGHGQQ